jgi:hypothetical protein
MGDSSKTWLKPNLNLVQFEGENQVPSWEKFMSRWTVILTFLGNLTPFPLKISNAILNMNCVPGDSAQLLYW